MPLSHAKVWKGLDALARREGTTPSGLACRAGLDPTSFNPSKRFASGHPARPRWPSTESLMRVLSATGLSLAEFATLADDAGPEPSLPVLGLAKAGDQGFFDDAGLPLSEDWDRAALPRPKDTLFSLEIDGDSMVPLYRPGDKVIVDLDQSQVRRGDRVALRTRSGETLAKELRDITTTALTLYSYNPDYPDRIIAREDVVWIARIIWVSQ